MTTVQQLDTQPAQASPPESAAKSDAPAPPVDAAPPANPAPQAGEGAAQTHAGGESADSGLFGSWAGLSGGLNSLFGGGEEAGATTTAEPPKQSPSLLPLSKAASEIAASATSELESASKAAQIRLGQAAQGIERGWGTLNSFLDDFLSPPVDGQQVPQDGATRDAAAPPPPDAGAVSAAMERAAELLHERFPELDAGEEAIDVYECSLVQKYKCTLNSATPEKTFAFAGVLYVTAAHLAMYVVDDGGAFGAPFGVVVPLTAGNRVQRGSKAMLRVVTNDENSYVFAAFASDDAFKAAVDLLHQIVDEQTPAAPADTSAETS